jgi:FkbM family methyltransferase
MLKRVAKAVVSRTPYRVVRDQGVNRFQGIDAALANLRVRGFNPDLIIDGGAHLGDFALLAARVFPDARYHLIEPQRACMDHLRRVAQSRGWTVHPVALGAGDQSCVPFSHTDVPSTGAHVKEVASEDTVTIEVVTLNDLFGREISEHDRVLLKLDLQGYELHALRGADQVLPRIEVILTEVSFYAQAYEPSILDLMTYLQRFSLQVYDIAALTGRRRDNRAHQGDFIFVRQDSELLADTRWE